MIHPMQNKQLKKLEEMIKDGRLTQGKAVGPGTMVCVVQKTPFGMAYAQEEFERMAPMHQVTLLGKIKGDMVNEMKVVAVFDVWEIKKERPTPVQVFDN
jgi:hypothetical protein